MRIAASTGDIHVENVSASTLDLSVTTGFITVAKTTCREDMKIHVSTGKAVLADITCNNLTSSGSTGNISLKNVIATVKMSITRSTGDIKFDRCDAAEIFAETNTGDVVGSLLTNKVFITHTDTGKVDIPKTSDGGKCEIRTDTGNIIITVPK